MTDEEFVAAFESTALPGDQFSHAGHVRVAWWYLTQMKFPEALGAFTRALRRFADANGASSKYHATVTVAFMALIAERLDETPELTWPEFAARHPELLAKTPSILARYYTDEVLTSERAKRVFVMPDRV